MKTAFSQPTILKERLNMKAFSIYLYDEDHQSLVACGEVADYSLGEELPEDRRFRLLKVEPLSDSLKAFFEVLPKDLNTKCIVDGADFYGLIRDATILGWNTGVDIWRKSSKITPEILSEYVMMPNPPQLVHDMKYMGEHFGFEFGKKHQILTADQATRTLIGCFQAALVISGAGILWIPR